VPTKPSRKTKTMRK